MTPFPDPAPGSVRRWAIFVTGSVNFILSMFYRVSTAVISPALVRDMGLSSTQLSDLAAAFFYAFALSQLPVGVAIDRLGSRLTMALLSGAAMVGVLLFSLGQTPSQLLTGRILLGIGMSGNFMVLLTLLAAWFPVDRFGFLSGLAVSVGVLGNLLATTPLAVLTQWVGWRTSFLIFGAANAIAVAAFLAVIRDRPLGQSKVAHEQKSLTAGLWQMFRMYSYWAISLANFVRYGWIAALQGLWAAPFLIYGLRMGEIATSNALLCMGLGYMAGMPVFGSLSDRVFRSRKQVVLGTMILFSLLSLSVVGWSETSPMWLVALTFFGLGFTASPGQILYAHMKELLPPSMVAQALTAVNLFTILGAGVMTQILGWVVGSEPAALSGLAGFRDVWYVGAGALALVALLYSAAPDSTALRRHRQ
jgi:MFS family permease